MFSLKYVQINVIGLSYLASFFVFYSNCRLNLAVPVCWAQQIRLSLKVPFHLLTLSLNYIPVLKYNQICYQFDDFPLVGNIFYSLFIQSHQGLRYLLQTDSASTSKHTLSFLFGFHSVKSTMRTFMISWRWCPVELPGGLSYDCHRTSWVAPLSKVQQFDI